MKKILALAVVAAFVSAPSFATVKTEVSQASDNETSFQAGYVMDNGISVGAEYIYDFAKEHHKETSLQAAWKVDVMEGLYIEPLLAVTMPSKATGTKYISDNEVKFEKGVTYKVGVKTGYDFDFGLYTSARYRFDMREDKASQVIGGKESGKLQENVHRTDLTVGYSMDVITISTNWVHKEFNSEAKSQGSKATHKTNSNDYEFKIAYTAMKDVTPYIQYTVKDDMNKPLKDKKESRDNVFKLGVQMAF